MTALLVAVLSGLCGAVMGIAIRLGTRRGALVPQLYLIIGVTGFALFAWRAAAEARPPALVLGAAVAGGASQYACLHFLRKALGRGPLTAAWSAASLGFLPVFIYAALALGEAPTLGNLVSLVAGVGCVMLASTLQSEPGVPDRPAPHAGRGFAGLLLGILLLNGLLSVFIKQLAASPSAAGGTLLAQYQNSFFAVMYAALCSCLLLEQFAMRRPWAAPRASLVAGLAAAVGSTGYMMLIGRVAHLPAAVVFTVSNMAQVAGTFLLAAWWIGEPRTRRWYAVLGLALLSIFAAQAEALVGRGPASGRTGGIERAASALP